MCMLAQYVYLMLMLTMLSVLYPFASWMLYMNIVLKPAVEYETIRIKV